MGKFQQTPRVKTHMCWFHCGEGSCTYGDTCQYAHSPEQLFLTVDFKCPDWVREMWPDLGERYDALMKEAEENGTLAKMVSGEHFSEQGKGFADGGFQGKGWNSGPSQGKGGWGGAG